ncbi:uncharacterized protein BO97DRAFT_17725 [Aspergillus homomorphus CBS 101889]|uniref:Uncharacterized protein n=1 Tax=Aspergillus homomorphus (strain CBS 101889) TaxID=1450537 RepID=A0A395I715_ASPHC|nr:hypothetical protein BO97DRAFT_17725 [Aspergillus homomorphus CBS 101889]RAL14034.1 hypothetical protein BO97DRAFT_17725 [Aspergillus homomorphus CBS 101889]
MLSFCQSHGLFNLILCLCYGGVVDIHGCVRLDATSHLSVIDSSSILSLLLSSTKTTSYRIGLFFHHYRHNCFLGSLLPHYCNAAIDTVTLRIAFSELNTRAERAMNSRDSKQYKASWRECQGRMRQAQGR